MQQIIIKSHNVNIINPISLTIWQYVLHLQIFVALELVGQFLTEIVVVTFVGYIWGNHYLNIGTICDRCHTSDKLDRYWGTPGKVWTDSKVVTLRVFHDDVIIWKHFPRYWRGIHRSPVNSPHEGQLRGALMLTLICARINGWVNNR